MFYESDTIKSAHNRIIIDLSLSLFNTRCGKYSISKELKYTAVFSSANNKTQCVSLLLLSLTFMTYTPSFILGKMFLEKPPLIRSSLKYLVISLKGRSETKNFYPSILLLHF